MSEQRTPEAMSTQAENDLICEKLLGWKRSARGAIVAWSGWHNGTPSFTTWAEAGLILEEMAARGYSPKVGVAVPGKWYGVNPLGEASYAATGPLAIRAAALEYIKAAT